MRCPIPRWLLKKKPTFEFFSRIPGVPNMYPITPMRMQKPEWLQAEATAVAREDKTISFDNANLRRSIARCPGIRSLLNTGWMVRNWQDIYIRVNADGSYEWKSAIDQTQFEGVPPCIGEHNPNSFARSEFLRHKVPILKLHTPWAANIPEGYTLYQKGLPYQEHDMFEVGEGVFSWDYNVFEVNVQLIFSRPGDYFLPAGMPLSHLIPMRKETFIEEVRESTPEDMAKIKRDHSVLFSTFARNYGVLKKFLVSNRSS